MLAEFNSEDAMGSSFRESEKTAESLAGRINSLKNNFDELINKITSSDFLKEIVDDADKLIDVLNDATPILKGILDILGSITGVATDVVKHIGLIPTVFAAMSVKGTGKLKQNTPSYAPLHLCA